MICFANINLYFTLCVSEKHLWLCHTIWLYIWCQFLNNIMWHCLLQLNHKKAAYQIRWGQVSLLGSWPPLMPPPESAPRFGPVCPPEEPGTTRCFAGIGWECDKVLSLPFLLQPLREYYTLQCLGKVRWENKIEKRSSKYDNETDVKWLVTRKGFTDLIVLIVGYNYCGCFKDKFICSFLFSKIISNKLIFLMTFYIIKTHCMWNGIVKNKRMIITANYANQKNIFQKNPCQRTEMY